MTSITKMAAFCFIALLFSQISMLPRLSPYADAQASQATGVSSGTSLTQEANKDSQTNIVALSIIIDEAIHFDELATWLRALDFRNFTFVVVESKTNWYILRNATRVSILKQYGKVIPRLPYMQAYEPASRVGAANFTLNEFADALGYVPKGMMDFIPDTYTARYLSTRGVEYYQGYSFDQYNVDRMSMRGGFQMPYYASASNILCPSTSDGGIVVLPHSTWDWVASFTKSHNMQLHPMNLINEKFEESVGAASAKDYFVGMIDNTFAGSSPFGYVTVQFEWSWCYREGDTLIVSDWIQTLLSKRSSYSYLTFEDAVKWFRVNYRQTPAYRISFVSPYDGQQIEWYFDVFSRVARCDGNVVSFVDYTEQQPDRYLNLSGTVAWLSPPNSTNGLDNSLTFKIDALGGGFLRAPIATPSVSYVEDLQGFTAYYDRLLSTRSFEQPTVALCSAILITLCVMTAIFVKTRKISRSRGRT